MMKRYSTITKVTTRTSRGGVRWNLSVGGVIEQTGIQPTKTKALAVGNKARRQFLAEKGEA